MRKQIVNKSATEFGFGQCGLTVIRCNTCSLKKVAAHSVLKLFTITNITLYCHVSFIELWKMQVL